MSEALYATPEGAEGPAADPTPIPPPSPPPAPDLATPIDVDALRGMPIFPEPICWGLVAYLYMEVLRVDPTGVATVKESIRRAARVFSLQLHKDAYGMRQVAEPGDWSLVLMWPGTQKKRPHCGVFWHGKVLHATETGVLSQELASLRATYPTMEFWTP